MITIIFVILAILGFLFLMFMPIKMPFKNFVAAFIWFFICVAIATISAIMKL